MQHNQNHKPKFGKEVNLINLKELTDEQKLSFLQELASTLGVELTPICDGETEQEATSTQEAKPTILDELRTAIQKDIKDKKATIRLEINAEIDIF